MSKYKIGLALSGGSIKGFAHLGVLKWLEENNLHPEILAGTSAGALVGAFYACGYSIDEVLELLSSNGFLKMTTLTMRGGGLFSATNFHRHLKRNLRYKKLEDLPLPLRIVATDLDRGEQHVFTEGKLADIVLASCSIPILFTPVVIGGETYVDGGLFRNFPATIIREDCETLIGMNLGPVSEEKVQHSMTAIANRAWELVFRQNTVPDREACDYLLETMEVTKYSMFEVSAASALVTIGYELASKELASLATGSTTQGEANEIG